MDIRNSLGPYRRKINSEDYIGVIDKRKRTSDLSERVKWVVGLEDSVASGYPRLNRRVSQMEFTRCVGHYSIWLDFCLLKLW